MKLARCGLNQTKTIHFAQWSMVYSGIRNKHVCWNKHACWNNLYVCSVPTEREWMKRVLKLLVGIFMLSRVGLVPGSNISKIYGLKFEKTQILEFSLQNDSF